jgi:hypothetical protein
MFIEGNCNDCINHGRGSESEPDQKKLSCDNHCSMGLK